MQIYDCTSTPAGVAWVFRAPEADLYANGEGQVGTRDAGPTWEWNSGGWIKGPVAARFNAPTAGAIPWLRLTMVDHDGPGVLSKVTTILRLDTVGEVAPSGGCDAATVGAKRAWTTRPRTTSTGSERRSRPCCGAFSARATRAAGHTQGLGGVRGASWRISATPSSTLTPSVTHTSGGSTPDRGSAASLPTPGLVACTATRCGMRYGLLGVGLVACTPPTAPPADVPDTPPIDRPYPAELTQWGYAPLTPTFGYDPEGAAAVYGHALQFDNLDPNGFPETPEGDASRRALGWLTTHPVTGGEMPIWLRIAVEPDLGPVSERLTRLGFLPSPYRGQFAATPSLPAEDGGEPVAFGVSLSLAEPITSFDEGDAGRRDYVGLSCMSCHGGVFGDHVVAGAPNKQYNAEMVMRLFDFLVGIDVVLHRYPDKASDSVNLAIANALAVRGEAAPRRIDVAPAELAITAATAKVGAHVWRDVFSAETNTTVGPNASTWAGPYAQFCSLTPDGVDYDDWVIDETDGRGPLFERMMAEVDAWGPLPIVSARPWWLGRYTGSHFVFYISRHGVNYSAPDLAIATTSPPNYGNAHTPRFDDRYERSADIQTYIGELQSPPFPGEIDWTKAATGLQIYADTCARCHGALAPDGAVGADTTFTLTFDETASRVPSSESGTDTAYFDFAAKIAFCEENFRSNGQYDQYPFGNGVPYPGDEPFIGAPPLVGVWASAPYFHNASVPTVYQVLNPAARPTVWRLDPDPYAYDYDDVGVVFEALDSAPVGEKVDPFDWYVYDTQRRSSGMSNAGHDFGANLTDPERYAVIELLKGLRTDNVSPNPVNSAWER